MVKQVGIALALSCALLSAAPALAQYPEIRTGQPVGGTLASSDPVDDDGSHYDVYLFQGRRGERISISLRSDDFDAYLGIARTAPGGDVELTDTNDDAGDSTDSVLNVTLDADGAYYIVATTFEGAETGAYRLLVESRGMGAPSGAPAGSTSASPIAFGQTISGALSAGDNVMADDSFYDLYRFIGRAGQRVEVVMRSADFDAYLAVGRMEGGEFSDLETDDDGAGGTDARVRLSLATDGEYVIRANSLAEGETGSYTVSLAEAAPAPPAPAPTAIRANQRVEGQLSTSDPVEDDDSHYDHYLYNGREGERLIIDLRSGDFDAYLAIGRLVDGDFEELDSDDDGGEGTDAMLVFTLPSNGGYVIRANSLMEGETGAYTLQVRSER